MNPRIAIIGTGAVGSLIARRCMAAGWPPHLWSRTPERARTLSEEIGGSVFDIAKDALAECDTIWLTVPDDAIRAVADTIRAAIPPGALVIHTSGHHDAAILGLSGEDDRHGVSCHPLISVADPAIAADRFSGTACFLDGSDVGLERLEPIVETLGGKPIRLAAGRKAFYHAGAVVGSNLLVALFDLAESLLAESGVPENERPVVLLGLMQGTLQNIRALGLPEALTGPVARGDANVIRDHLAALEALDDDVAKIYKELSRRLLPIARAKGDGNPAGWEQIEAQLDGSDQGNS